MPQQFKDYPTTRKIIDGTEIFIEVPSPMKSQSMAWSSYKNIILGKLWMEYLQMV